MRFFTLINVAILLSYFFPSYSQDISKELIPYRKGNLWGYADAATGKIVIPLKYLKATTFSYSVPCCLFDDIAKVKLGSKSYLINKKGELLDEQKFIQKYIDELPPPEMVQLIEDKKSPEGAVVNGNTIIVPSGKYDEIFLKKGFNPYLVVKKNNKQGLVNRENVEIIPIIHDSIDVFIFEDLYDTTSKSWVSEKYVILKEAGSATFTLMKLNNKNIFISGLTAIKPFSSHAAIQQKVENKLKWGLLNKDLQLIIKPKYLDVLEEYNGTFFKVAIFTKDKSHLEGYVNTNDKEYFE